jgi:Tat protein secretion system quality control protein TatD with DNase activity
MDLIHRPIDDGVAEAIDVKLAYHCFEGTTTIARKFWCHFFLVVIPSGTLIPGLRSSYFFIRKGI